MSNISWKTKFLIKKWSDEVILHFTIFSENPVFNLNNIYKDIETFYKNIDKNCENGFQKLMDTENWIYS